jgi:hypothetical protein
MLGLGRWRGDVEQLAGEREVVGLYAARQQTVVADAISASWGRVFDFPADQALGSVALDAPDPMAEVHLRSPPKGR